MILKVSMAILWLGIVPLYIGALLIKRQKTDQNSVIMAYISGLIAMFAIFEIIAIPLIFLRASLVLLIMIYGTCLLALTCISIYKNRTLKEMRRLCMEEIRSMNKGSFVILIFLVAMITTYALNQHFEGDDSFYVGTAVETCENDNMFIVDPYTGDQYDEFPARYVLAPLPVFVGVLSKLLDLHPATIAHSVLPFVLIPLVFMIYYIIGKHLFLGKRKEIHLFLVFVAILHLFGFHSIYTASTFLLLRIWQGKAIVANIMIPLCFALSMKTMKEDGGFWDWGMLFITTLAACMVSQMAVALIPISIGSFGLCFAIYKKSVRILLKSFVCILPCILFGVIYLVIK